MCVCVCVCVCVCDVHVSGVSSRSPDVSVKAGLFLTLACHLKTLVLGCSKYQRETWHNDQRRASG